MLIAHADDPATVGLERGVDYADYRPDRVAMQDATAQMALLQFMLAGLPAVAVPSTVHCDHLIQARVGADADMEVALDTNREVYEFLRSVSAKYGIGFWKPGSGIIHQVVLENYAFPGGMMIGTDSHTPNAGGLGMVAIGVGGADAMDVMAGWPYNTRVPQLIGVKLTGALSGWAAAKDVILAVAGILTVKGGTGAIVEYFGPGAATISATGQGDDLQHGCRDRRDVLAVPVRREHGEVPEGDGTRSDRRPRRSRRRAPAQRPGGRRAIPSGSTTASIEIDLSTLEPHLVGPHTPDLDRPISQIAADAAQAGYPREISAALVGSCTNSSYEDIGRAAHVARQATAKGMTVKAPLMITPGSEQVRATIERDGLLADLEAIGATVLANACGPCIGQWKREDAPAGPNTIVTSFNRNFPARNDGNADTFAFIGSPETVVGMALTGVLDGGFVDEFDPPTADDLPTRGFDPGASGFLAPASDPAVDRGRGRAGLRAARTADAVPRLGRARSRRVASAAEGSGQVHDRPHLARRAVVAVPRPPHEHLAEHVPRRDERVRHSGTDPRARARVQGRRHRMDRGRRRELRRRFVA